MNVSAWGWLLFFFCCCFFEKCTNDILHKENSTVLLQPLAGSGLHTHSRPCLALAEPHSTLACASIVPKNQPGAALLLHLLPLDISSPNRPVALMLFSLIIAVIITVLVPVLVPSLIWRLELQKQNQKMTTKKSRRVVFQRKLEAPSKERGSRN